MEQAQKGCTEQESSLGKFHVWTQVPLCQCLLRTSPVTPRKQHPARNTLPTALLLELHPVPAHAHLPILTSAPSPLKRRSPLPTHAHRGLIFRQKVLPLCWLSA